MQGDFSFLNVAELNARLISLLILAGQHSIHSGTDHIDTRLNHRSPSRYSSISNCKNRTSGLKAKRSEERHSKNTRLKEAKTHDLIGPGNTETDVAEPARSGEPVAARGTQVLRIDEPGTAPRHPHVPITCRPSTTVGRRAVVIVIPAILRPLPDIFVHIMKTESVWLFLTDWMGLVT